MTTTSPIERYAKDWRDRINPGEDESILGHLVLEQHMGITASLEDLAPNVRYYHEITEKAKKQCGLIGFGALATSLLLGTISVPVAVLPAIASAIAIGMWSQSKNELPRREAEYRLLRQCPNLPHLLWKLLQQGATVPELLGAYDTLLDSYEAIMGEDYDASDAQIAMTLATKLQAIRSFGQGLPSSAPTPSAASGPKAVDVPVPTPKPAARPTAQVAPSEPRPGGIRLHKGLPEIVTQQKCCVIFGTPGSGKGMQLANAIRALKHAKPSTYVFGVDPKNDPKEDGYWEGGAFDRVERKNIAALGANAAADWIFRQVSEFHELSLKSDRPCLLVWDEVMTSKAALAAAEGEKALNDDGRWAGEWIIPPGSKMLADIRFWATGWISSGDSRGIRAWFVTQSPNLDDLPFGGGVKGQLRFVALARPEDGPLVGKLSESKTIVKGQADMEAIRGLCAQSPVGRAIYLSDQERWLPLDRLPNPSGYDRDKCQGQAN